MANEVFVGLDVTGVSIGSQIGDSKYEIIITFNDTAPTNAGQYIGYADYGAASFAGQVPRGYVRDNKTVSLRLASTKTINGVTPGSWNWLVPGQQLIVT